MSLKSKLYKILRILGDIDAIRKGNLGRFERRASKKILRKTIRKLFK